MPVVSKTRSLIPLCLVRIELILAAVEAAPQPLIPLTSMRHSFSVLSLALASATVPCANAGSAQASVARSVRTGVLMAFVLLGDEGAETRPIGSGDAPRSGSVLQCPSYRRPADSGSTGADPGNKPCPFPSCPPRARLR